MAQEILVEEIQKVKRALSERQGPIALMMLFAEDADPADQWNLIVSARGYDHMSRLEAVKDLAKLVRMKHGQEHLALDFTGHGLEDDRSIRHRNQQSFFRQRLCRHYYLMQHLRHRNPARNALLVRKRCCLKITGNPSKLSLHVLRFLPRLKSEPFEHLNI